MLKSNLPMLRITQALSPATPSLAMSNAQQTAGSHAYA